MLQVMIHDSRSSQKEEGLALEDRRPGSGEIYSMEARVDSKLFG
jgi:hypothetical protein